MSQPAYPRALTPLEREVLEWLLPIGSIGYDRYRQLISTASVIGPGRRGEGEIILGREDQKPDFSAPLAPVYSYGVIETAEDSISVTLREIFEDQISVEIVGRSVDEPPDLRTVVRKWTYAAWKPGLPCPQCGNRAREVRPVENIGHVLAFCPHDKRIWIYDAVELTCRPIPVTQYHNELMIYKNIRAPEVALKSERLFLDIAKYSDHDLASAFAAYNRLKAKVDVSHMNPTGSPPQGGIVRRIIRSVFSR